MKSTKEPGNEPTTIADAELAHARPLMVFSRVSRCGESTRALR